MSLAKDMAKEIEKSAGNKIALKLGDRVSHRLTGMRGTVEEVATIGDQTLLSVRAVSGKLLTKLNRQEFVLATDAPTALFASSSVSEFVGLAAALAMPELDGREVSHNSILEELV